MRTSTTLAATVLACLTLAGCFSEGPSYRTHERVYARPAGPSHHYNARHDRRDWDRGRSHARDDRHDRRDWRDDRRDRDGRFVYRDGRRIWVPGR
ncbi:hypothetical protein ACQKKX_02570 [Neorhizobium sp. NPDC001467]|uniref:hypothetical protein n=1 Tax=Neorhizobium sp. NPDC001467 TaxID=3390595 RepID=UPI003D039A5D